MSTAPHVATLGHPADGVVINQGTSTTTTTTSTTAVPAHHHHHTHHHTAAHPVGPTAVHTQAGPNNSDGRAVLSDIGGPMSGTVVLGGQCECTRNGGVCKHGAGQCICRGCTAAATSLNPGINIGVSTHQYTAPAGTTGLGGGVGEAGTGMAGILNPTNTVGAPVNTAVQNCECVKTAGVCNCPPGQCVCTNCKAGRQSRQATAAAAPLAGSEYATTNAPVNYTSANTTATPNPIGSNLATNTGPITDNSNVPYEPKDYTPGHPVKTTSTTTTHTV